MNMLTRERIAALNHINRYNGWTVRPYSVLEHTLVGAENLKLRGHPLTHQLAFMLHDVHESEWQDLVPRTKQMMPEEYHERVAQFDDGLMAGLNLPGDALAASHQMDIRMRRIEIHTLVTDQSIRAAERQPCEFADADALRMVRDAAFAGPAAVTVFFDQMARIVAGMSR